jgi:transportin-1
MFMAPKIAKSISHNAAITYGRLGLVNAQYMATYLDRTAKAWCLTSRLLKAGDEKASAYK